MDKGLEGALTKFINLAIAGVEKGGDLAGQHLPEVLEQLLVYRMIMNTLGLVLGITMIYWLYCSIKKMVSTDPSATGMYLLITVPTLWVFVCVAGVTKILVAPKLYILEYLRALL